TTARHRPAAAVVLRAGDDGAARVLQGAGSSRPGAVLRVAPRGRPEPRPERLLDVGDGAALAPLGARLRQRGHAALVRLQHTQHVAAEDLLELIRRIPAAPKLGGEPWQLRRIFQARA